MASCRKRRYRDRIAAQLALASTRRSGNWRRAEVRAYHCPSCCGWHLTSQQRNAKSPATTGDGGDSAGG